MQKIADQDFPESHLCWEPDIQDSHQSNNPPSAEIGYDAEHGQNVAHFADYGWHYCVRGGHNVISKQENSEGSDHCSHFLKEYEGVDGCPVILHVKLQIEIVFLKAKLANLT